MLITSDYIEPAELTGYARAAVDANPTPLARYLPFRVVDDLFYKFSRGGSGLVEAASYRAFDAPSPFGSRPGLSEVTGQLPPISQQIRLSEYDQLRLRANADDQILRAIYDDAERLVRAIVNRFERARGQALTTGKVTLAENGLVAEVDFGRRATHTVNAGTVWTTTASADILGDLIAWVDTYRATNGVAPGRMIVSNRVARLVQRNAGVIAAITGSAAGRNRVTSAEVSDLLVSEGLPAIEINDQTIQVNGAATRVIPEDRVIFVPEPVDPASPEGTELGATLLGTTAEAGLPEYGLEGDQPGIVAGTYRSQNPVGIFTNAVAIGLPVLANPDLTFSADVL